jgi:hypothetical protein
MASPERLWEQKRKERADKNMRMDFVLREQKRNKKTRMDFVHWMRLMETAKSIKAKKREHLAITVGNEDSGNTW